MNKEEQQNNENVLSGLPAEIMQQLTPAKTRLILMYLTGQYTQKKISQVLGVGENTIRAWLLDPNVQTAIKEIQAREFAVVESNLKAMRYKALNTMNELLDSTMDNVRFQAAKDILDRGGHKPQQNIKVDKTVTTREEQLKDLIAATMSDVEIIDISDVEEVE